MNLTQIAAELTAALKSERAGVQALVVALTAELNALRQGHTDQLGDHASRKRELLLHVAHLGDARARLLERLGVSGDRRGMETWLAAHANANLHAEWREFLAVAQQAQRLNRDNGILVDAGFRSNQNSLQSLMAAGSAQHTYGPGGRAMSPMTGSRTLASA